MSHHKVEQRSTGDGCTTHYVNSLNEEQKRVEPRSLTQLVKIQKYVASLFLISGLLFGGISIGSAFSIFPETATAGFSEPLFTGNGSYTINIPENEFPLFQPEAFWSFPPGEAFLTGISAYSDHASDMNIFGYNIPRKSAPVPSSLLLLCSGLVGLSFFSKNTRCPDRLIFKRR